MREILPILFLIMLFSGCATQQHADTLPIDFNTLPSLAAEFETVVSATGAHAHESRGLWRALREPYRLETRELAGNTGEEWVRTDNKLLFHRRLYHNDHQVIEYSPVDLNMLAGGQSWDKIALLLDPELLERLKPAGGAKVLGRLAHRYRGTFGGVKYEILWLPVEKIPASINEITPDGHATTSLKNLYPLAESPWAFADISQYRLIEYSDIGDMERDPFVTKVLGHIPGTSVHAH